MFVEDFELFDLILSLIYSILGLGIALLIRRRLHSAADRMLIPFVFFKLICAYAFVVIHIFIYQGGDTFLYFAGSKFIVSAILNNPEYTLSYLFGPVQELKHIVYTDSFPIIRAFNSEITLFQSRLTSIFTMMAFQKYASTTVLVSLFSSIGGWMMYKTFCHLYPKLYKLFAFAVLFFPTVIIWSSGILKDTFTLTALGFIFYGILLLMRRKRYITAIFLIAIGIYLNLMLKPYILYIFIPAMLIWYQGYMLGTIKNKFLRIISTPAILLLIVGASFFFLQTVSSIAGKYSVENVESLAVGFHEWHTYLAQTRDQSGYSLGEVEFTIMGVLAKAPQSLLVTYLRPWPFEVRNAAMALESLESFVLLILSLYVVFKTGLMRTLKLIFTNTHLRAFLFFAIFFGIVVGFTSYNFGALSRYKIPCIPFYGASLAIIWHLGRQKKAQIRSAYSPD